MFNHFTDGAISWIINRLKWLWLDAFGFNAATTTISADESTITQISGTVKLVTVVESDSKITEKLYKDNVLQSTKVTTVVGNKVNEVIS